MANSLMLPGNQNTAMAKNNILSTILLALTLSLLLNCSAKYPAVDNDTRHTFHDWISTPDLLSRLQERGDRIQTIKATLSMTIENRHIEHPRKMRGFVAISGSERLRLKGFGFLGIELFDLVIRDNIVELLIPPTGDLYMGTRQEAAESDMALPIDTEEMYAIFSAGIYSASHQNCRRQDDAYILTMPVNNNLMSNRSRKLWIDKTTLDIVRMQTFHNGIAETEYVLGSHRHVGENRLPFAVEIIRHSDDSHIMIKINSVQVNEEIDEAVFTIIRTGIQNSKQFQKWQDEYDDGFP